MNTSEALQLFKNAPPFQELDEATLAGLAKVTREEFFPRGAAIDGPRAAGDTSVRIIRKGAIKVTIPFGRNDEALVDYRGEGELFGYLALLTGDQLRGEIVFLEDTVCYQIDRHAVLGLLQGNPAFARQFFSTFLHKYVAKPYRELGKKQLFYGGGDRLLFTTPVGELATRTLITAGEDISIREATEIMARNQIGSLVLVNALGLPAGIITNKDLRDKVISKGRDTSQPVKRIQSLSLVKAEAGELCIEALFKMLHYNINHLLVLDNGRMKGIITTHDLMRLQGKSPIAIVREIEERHTLEELASPARKIQDLLGHFLQEGVRADHILRIVTQIGDRLLGKVLELAQKEAGPPPVPYGFLSLGSSGRREQVLPTLADCAVVYGDTPSGEDSPTITAYFERLVAVAKKILLKLHLPQAPARDAENLAVWCMSLSSWKKTFTSWMVQGDISSVHACLPFLDFRCLFGENQMVEELRETVRSGLQAGAAFFKSMAATLLHTVKPSAAPEHGTADTFDLHMEPFDINSLVITPLVDVVRFIALEKGVRETNTLARLRALRNTSAIVRQYGRELEYAFDLVFGFRLQHQYRLLRQGLPLHSTFPAEQLNILERKIVLETSALLGSIKDRLLTEHPSPYPKSP